MPNFSPLVAIGIFGAAHFDKKWLAFFVPVTAPWLSDLFIDNVLYTSYYPSFSWFYHGFYWQYGSCLLIVMAAVFMFRSINTKTVVVGILTSAAIFFLVSNFGVWLGSKVYPQNISGLLSCYVAAIPFLQGTVLGNLFYSVVLFWRFLFAKKAIPGFKNGAWINTKINIAQNATMSSHVK